MEILLGIGLALSAAATAYGIYANQAAAAQQAAAQQAQAQAQAESLRAQADVEAQNQLQSSLSARRDNRKKIAAMEAAYAASGVAIEGTPTTAMANSAREQELEVLMAESASGYKRKLLFNEAENTLTYGAFSSSMTQSTALAQSIGIGLSGAANMATIGSKLADKKSTGDGAAKPTTATPTTAKS